MYAIYGNMDPINIPQMLAYIPAPWILWILKCVQTIFMNFPGSAWSKSKCPIWFSTESTAGWVGPFWGQAPLLGKKLALVGFYGLYVVSTVWLLGYFPHRHLQESSCLAIILLFFLGWDRGINHTQAPFFCGLRSRTGDCPLHSERFESSGARSLRFRRLIVIGS